MMDSKNLEDRAKVSLSKLGNMYLVDMQMALASLKDKYTQNHTASDILNLLNNSSLQDKSSTLICF